MATETQIDVVMPQMGVSVSEGTITKWLKQEGEQIARDEPLLEISTDKVDTEVPSPGEGVVAKILVQEGETVEVGTVLAVIAPEGAEVAAPRRRARGAARAGDRSEAADEADAAPSSDGRRRTATPAPRRRPHPRRRRRQSAATAERSSRPVVARIASEHGVDPSEVPGTGRGGRVTKKDILAFIECGGQRRPAAPAPHRAGRRARTGRLPAPQRRRHRAAPPCSPLRPQAPPRRSRLPLRSPSRRAPATARRSSR